MTPQSETEPYGGGIIALTANILLRPLQRNWKEFWRKAIPSPQVFTNQPLRKSSKPQTIAWKDVREERRTVQHSVHNQHQQTGVQKEMKEWRIDGRKDAPSQSTGWVLCNVFKWVRRREVKASPCRHPNVSRKISDSEYKF